MTTTLTASPLLNSTFTLFRVSPLHHGDQDLLNPTPLRIHACRLRDLLRGDKLRGVHVGDDTGSNLGGGRLEDCTWELLDIDTLWTGSEPLSKQQKTTSQSNRAGDRHHDRRLIASDDACGIYIQLRYERVIHTAILLRNMPADKPSPGFTSFPLLLVRIPQPLRQTVIDHLSQTFDAHITPLQMSNDFLAQSLESMFRTITEPTQEGDFMESLVRSISITLAVPAASPQLKTLDINVASTDVPKFLSNGRKESMSRPFTGALSNYLSAQLALNTPAITNGQGEPSFRLVKVACALLALAKDGKLKFTPPSLADVRSRRALDLGDEARETALEALRNIVESLIDEASG